MPMKYERNASLPRIHAKRGKGDMGGALAMHSPNSIQWLEIHPAFAGLMAFLLIFFFYFGIITLANSFPHALQQFSLDWPWIAALATGLGLQVKLHLQFKHLMRRKMLKSSGMMASGGISGTAMAACCAHHISDALPFLGLAGAAGFLFDYREVFLLFGVLSNSVGIIYLLKKYSEYGLESGMPFGIQGYFKDPESLNFSILGSAAIFLSYVARFFIIR
ncbi:MAG TPA: hypothetical protein VJI13_05270 [Candidatus Norongarragalinales archaeon]|nr:hypothetical protein [Candidatus Norongarragalinales archaeon]